MNKTYKVININWVSLISLDEVVIFLVQNLFLKKKLIGYDFFTYIPTDWLLPCVELSDNFSESNLSEEEKIWKVLIKVFNKVNLHNYYQALNREDLLVFHEEWIRYLDWKETNAIIGCEFIYQ